MTTIYKVLGQLNPASDTPTTVYTVPSSNSAVISSIAICNTNAANALINIAVCPANTAITTAQYIVNNATCAPYDTIFLTLGVTLATTDTVVVQSNNNDTSFNIFGSEIY
jgi:hypothetical protein